MIKIENKKLEILKDLNAAALKIALYLKSKEENKLVFCSNKEIQNSLDITKATVIRNLSKLQKMNLIHIHKCPPYQNVFEVFF